MWTDNETKTDLVGFKVHADLIRSVVTDENLLPVVLGLFGDWGGGKSSIMQMLEQDLENEEEIVCLYFNGWMFEGYEDAKTALLSSILIQLGEHKRFGPKAKDWIVELLQRVNYMEILKTGTKAGWKYAIPLLITYASAGTIPAVVLPFLAGMIDEKKDSEDSDKKDEDINWSKLLKESKGKSDLLEVRKFRDDFEKMLKKTDVKSLIILIDDLDRCLPERIIETLEAIKLFVLVPRTAFVIGADPRIVRHAIGNRYVKQQLDQSDASKLEVEELIKDYLEKLIQIPYHLPRLSPSEVETYINLLACKKFLDDDQNKLVLEDWAAKRSKNFYSAYRLEQIRAILGEENFKRELEEQLTWSSAIAQVLTEGLKGNPRQVKRMLNALLLRKKLAEVAGINIKDEILAKLMVLEYAHLSRFYELNEWQASEEGRPAKLKKLEENARGQKDAEKITSDDKLADWDTTSITKWLQIEPPLKDRDLRDYFWLMRDRTSSTLAGVNMVSPIVGRYFNDLTEGNDGEQELASKGAAGLDPPDREALIGLLEQHIRKHPGQAQGYEALLKLARNNIEDAAYSLLKIVREIKASIIPAAVAPKIKTVGAIDDQLKQEVQAVFVYFLENHPKTAIGRAAKAELEA